MAKVTGNILTDGRAASRYVGGKVQANAGFNSTGIVLGTGTVAFLGSMKEAGGFPPNGVRIIIGTTLLAILGSIADKSPVASAAKMLAILMLLAALIAYVPKFSNKRKVK